MRCTVPGALDDSLCFMVSIAKENEEGSLFVALIGMKLIAFGSEIVRRFVKSNEWQKALGLFWDWEPWKVCIDLVLKAVGAAFVSTSSSRIFDRKEMLAYRVIVRSMLPSQNLPSSRTATQSSFFRSSTTSNHPHLYHFLYLRDPEGLSPIALQLRRHEVDALAQAPLLHSIVRESPSSL